jgi:hypothetical protein
MFIACKKRDKLPPQKKEFTVTIENVSAPKIFGNIAVHGTSAG